MITSWKLPIFFVLLLVIFVLPQKISAQTALTFYVDSQYEPAGQTEEIALYLTTSSKTYVYVEQDYFNSLTSIAQNALRLRVQQVVDEFDDVTYPRVRALFGSEWTPGVDGDRKITVYLSEMKDGVNGYFRDVDEYSKAMFQNSNEREMIYINAGKINDSKANAYLAHEFQHLINFYQKTKLQGLEEERWLNEAKSEYAITASGFNDVRSGTVLEATVRTFLNSPNDALGIWEDQKTDFASASLFLHYLVDQYGTDFISTISQSSYVGSNAITKALREEGTAKTFSDVFIDWSIALFVNRSLNDSSLYKYANPFLQYDALHINPQISYTIQNNNNNQVRFSLAMQDLERQWYRFMPSQYGSLGGTLHINFETFSSTDYFRVPVVTTFLSGDVELFEAEVQNGKGSLNVPNFTNNISSVVIIPSSHTKIFDFSQANPYRIFSLSAFVQNNNILIQDGDLIRAKGDTKVYVVKGNYRRWLQSPEIFNNYGHLRWDNIKEVSMSQLNDFQESKLIKFSGDYRVYETDKFGVKRWLNMNPGEFEASGRAWGMIYEVNEFEFSRYNTGNDISQ